MVLLLFTILNTFKSISLSKKSAAKLDFEPGEFPLIKNSISLDFERGENSN